MAPLKKFVLIVAGGYGKRMGHKMPKQFIPIAGKPILIHTFEAFVNYSQDLIFILVLPSDHIDEWKKICSDNDFTTPHIIREGGESRFQSVRNGLEVIKEDGLVAIHDGVRPCVPGEVIESSFQVAERHGSAIASVILRDSVRQRKGKQSNPVNRDDFVIIQTPQTFRVDKIIEAYKIEEKPSFTDDATVFEAAGHEIALIEGSYSNIKVTSPGDLLMIEGLLGTDK